MQKPTPFLVKTISAFLLLFVCATGSLAQRNPTMTEQQRDAQKDSLYAEFSEHKNMPTAQSQKLAYLAAKEYVRRYGGDNDPYLPGVRKFLNDYEKETHNLEFYATYTAKNYAKAFETGRTILKTEPDNFFVLATLTQAGYENAVAGNATLNEETIGYATRAIQLVDGGKLSKPSPFTTMDVARGSLNFILGWFLKDRSPVEAAAAFKKAAQSDSPYHTDPMVYYRLGFETLKGEFTQVSTEYNNKFGNQQESPEQKAMFEQVRHLGDRVVDAYARAVALSVAPAQQEGKAKILNQLTELYKNLHNGSDAGLAELIANVLSKPLP